MAAPRFIDHRGESWSPDWWLGRTFRLPGETGEWFAVASEDGQIVFENEDERHVRRSLSVVNTALIRGHIEVL